MATKSLSLFKPKYKKLHRMVKDRQKELQALLLFTLASEKTLVQKLTLNIN